VVTLGGDQKIGKAGGSTADQGEFGFLGYCGISVVDLV
jgi:hypothetical protein